MSIQLCCRILVLAILTAAPPALATITVTTDADSGPGSLRAAIASAAPRELIRIPFAGTITLTSGPLVIEGSARIRGRFEGDLAISGGDRSRVLEIRPGAQLTIDDVVIANGRAELGDLPDPTVGSGGGIFNEGTVELRRVTIRDNFAEFSAGGVFNSGDLQADDVSISNNVGGNAGGGAIWNTGRVRLENGRFIENRGSWSTAFRNLGEAELRDCEFQGNRDVSTSSIDSWFILNEGSVTIEDCDIDQVSGGILNEGTLAIARATISIGFCEATCATLTNRGSMTVRDVSVSGTSFGGAAGFVNGTRRNQDARMLLDRVSVHDLRGSYLGVTNYGRLVALNSTFSNLRGTISSGTQGISNHGWAELRHVTIADNGVEDSIGVDSVANTGTLRIGASVIGLQKPSSSPDPELANFLCTNTGTIISLGNNVTADDSCGLTHPTDQIADPLLLPLADNGGRGPTHALRPDSPAIDVVAPPDCTVDVDGDPETPETPLLEDQRGIGRPQGEGCDAGAFERFPTCDAELLTCSADLASCETDLLATRAALADAESELARVSMALESALADADGDSVLDASDRCADTEAGATVDPRGCSQSQFCAQSGAEASQPRWHRHEAKTRKKARGSARALCRALDWRNDEPLSTNPRDCRYDRRRRACVAR